MKVLLMIVLGFAVNTAFAGNLIRIRCTDKSPSACEARLQVAMEKMACNLEAPARCEWADEINQNEKVTGQAIYCEVGSTNCGEPFPQLFGGVACHHGIEIRIPVRKLSLAYNTGLLRNWVRVICISDVH